MKFLSWNIQAPSTTDGNKFGIKEFKYVITQHDFACLQEVREEVHLPGYKTECCIRKGSWSGGVAIMVKKELTEGEKGRSVMAYIWPIYGLYMAYTRPIYGPYMAYIWPIHGL